MQRSKLEIVRLLAWETNELGEEIFCYTQHGRLVELAVLLLVAREKVTSVSLVKKSSLSQNDHDSSCLDHCVTLREFIISELARLSALQVKLEICCEDDKLSSSCKEKQNLMMSALLLLEIFERAGKTIESYLQNQVGWMIFLEFLCIVCWYVLAHASAAMVLIRFAFDRDCHSSYLCHTCFLSPFPL